MTSSTDVLALEARLDAVHGHVLELQSRLGTLEDELRGEPVRVRPPMREPTAEQVEIPTVTAMPGSVADPRQAPTLPPVVHAPPRATTAAPSSSPPTPAVRDDSPIRALAASGGAALLLGLICLAIYAIEQDWLSPGMRFVASLVVAAGLTMAAWPLARRTHAHVAGAIGGAGLGAWIASWLVARHVHELVSGAQVLLALGAGAAACLLIADRLRLRLMAILAALAACATPVLVGGRASDGLHELMIYQLALIAVAMVVDGRRRWSELPTLALVATWMLGGRWFATHGGPETAPAFMVWTAVMLVATTVSAWRLLLISADASDQADALERGHARARLLLGGLVTWAAAAWAFAASLPTIGAGTLALAAWHLGLGLVLHRRALGQGREGNGFATALVALAWVQAMVAGPLALAGATLVWWWIGLSVAALAWTLAAGARPRLAVLGRELPVAMIVAPSLAALVACVDAHGQPWALTLAVLSAMVPLVSSLVIASPETGPSGAGAPALGRRPHPVLALMSTLIWAGLAVGLGQGPIASRLVLGLVPVAVIGAFVCLGPSVAGLESAAIQVGAGACALLGSLVYTEALVPSSAHAPDSWGLAVVALLVGGLGLALVLRSRGARDRGELDLDALNNLGLLAAASFGLALALAASGACGSLGASVAMAHFGHTLALALTGLGLLALGLGWSEDGWRQLGLAALAGAALKVVLFDLAGAAFVWRALSFAGIGLVLIAGAYVYSRAQQRLDQTRA